jgi:hypothetical protein
MTMSPVNNPLQHILSILLNSTVRILLALLLVVSCYTCIAMSLLTALDPIVVIPLVVLNVIIFVHHWYVMTK